MKDFADWGGLEPQNLYITNEKQCLYHPFYRQHPIWISHYHHTNFNRKILSLFF